MFLPTRRFAVFAAVMGLVGAFLVESTTLSVLAVLGIVNAGLLIVLIVDAALAASIRKLDVERAVQGSVERGRAIPFGWKVTNLGRKTARASFVDEVRPSLRVADSSFAAKIPPGKVARAATTASPIRRGRIPFAGVGVRSVGPLGFGARQRRVLVPGELAVYPLFRSRRQADQRVRAAQTAGLRSARLIGHGTEFEALREYGVNDDFRRIDWRATARMQRPIVRTYRVERDQSVLVLLDNGRQMAGQVEGFPRVEHAMDAVLALCTVVSGMGDRCGLVAFDSEVRAVVPPDRRVGQVSRFTRAIFDLEPQLVESDFAAAFATTVQRFGRRSLLVILTDLADPSVSESLAHALKILGSRHIILIAGVTDPAVAAWAGADPGDVDETYLAAAASKALASRAQTAALLKARGAIVVDAVAEQLPLELVDTYLRVKQTGRL